MRERPDRGNRRGPLGVWYKASVVGITGHILRSLIPARARSARRCSRRARQRRSLPRLRGARKRRAGLRHRPRARPDGRPHRQERRDDRDEQGDRRGRSALPARGARGRATRSSRRETKPRTSSPCSPTQSAPPDESVYDQEIDPDGYQYLETRDGTKLAISVHPPTDITSVIPGLPLPDMPVDAPHAHPDRVLGLRHRRSGRPRERHLDHRQPHGLHGRRRQHARHRLLGRRLRLLRAAPRPRRL